MLGVYGAKSDGYSEDLARAVYPPAVPKTEMSTESRIQRIAVDPSFFRP